MRGERQAATTLATGVLHLFALGGFALAQPTLDVLARHPAFFVAHRSNAADVLILVAALLLVVPLFGGALLGAAQLASSRVRFALQAALVGVLLLAIGLPPLEDGLGFPAALAVVVSCVFAGAATWLYLRWAALRGFLTWLALAPFVFAALFLWKSPVALVAFAESDEPSRLAGVANDTPIIVVVLDELGTWALLDEHDAIDASRFPNFAALAREATWYRRARTVHTSTIHALPAIVTGNWPSKDTLPWHADHPDSLFRWLEASHELHIVESETMLAPPRRDGGDQGSSQRSLRLLADASLVAAHITLPAPLAESLPGIRGAWGQLLRPASPSLAAFGRKAVLEGFPERRRRIEHFIAGLADCNGACLQFLHILLPHRPWEYQPSGRAVVPWQADAMRALERWADDDWSVAQALQQHLLQVVATDAWLGALVDQLRSLGLYDEALLVVMADHGASFWPGESLRWLAELSHPEDILRVPFFVKAPGQRRGGPSDVELLTIDTLPTIASLLAAPLPWPVAGCAANDEGCRREREATRARVFDRNDAEVAVASDLPLGQASAERVRSLFGPGLGGLHVWGPHARLIGRSSDELRSPQVSSLRARVSPRALEAVRSDPSRFSPARISGSLRSRDTGIRIEGRPQVAIAIDGVVRATAPTFPHAAGSLSFSVFVAEEVLAPGRHTIEVHEIGPDAAKPLQLAYEGTLEIVGEEGD